MKHLSMMLLFVLAARLAAAQGLVPGSVPANLPNPADPPAPGPSFALAMEAAQTALAVCEKQDAHVSATIVDSAGLIKVQLVADGANKRAVVSSVGKALIANDFKMNSADVVEKSKTDPELTRHVKDNPIYVPGNGGLLIRAHGEIIGAIGVGGAHGGKNVDEGCARAGLEKISSKLK